MEFLPFLGCVLMFGAAVLWAARKDKNDRGGPA